MRAAFTFGINERQGGWHDALRTLINEAEEAGVLVMVSGIVGSNTTRKLDPKEFRGFALADDYAPVVFINATDTKAAQMFTLAHELAHVWLGQSGVADVDLAAKATDEVERWCNAVAAEFLVPRASIQSRYQLGNGDLADELDRLAAIYKVSTLVILRRLHDLDAITWERYRETYGAELNRVVGLSQAGSGGNWLNSQPWRVSRTFARALLGRTLSGNTTYLQAFRLIPTPHPETNRQLALEPGVVRA